jgi:hypothetical protein
MMVAAERAPWQNPKIVTTLMVVFLAGAATGALFMQIGLHDMLHRGAPRPAAVQNRDVILSQFKTQLDLSQPQADRLALVLDDYRQYYQSLQDQLDDLRATGKTRIMAILDEQQKQKFEKMMTDLGPQLTGK